MNYYLAIDIGASSGRHILSWLEEGKIHLKEVYRFKNGMVEKQGHMCWDADYLFREILTGMKKCREYGMIPKTMGIDTWAIDFALLNTEGRRLGDLRAYRDHRTDGMDQKVYQVISEKDLYARTGIQKQIFNTIYQLMAVKQQEPCLLEAAACMLLVPDYFHYLLTGVKKTEYTNASTTQLLNPFTKDWDWELIDQLGYPRRIFIPISLPGTPVGPLLPEIRKEVGFDCQVVLPATHDTGSAVAAVPSKQEDFLYISSGTWSLMGTEQLEADCSEESRIRNLTNEGGYAYRFRYLKNIMGMWMINSARAELAPECSFEALCKKAAAEAIPSLVPANHPRFLAPESMVKEVQEACRESEQEVPEGISQVAAVIYHSLAECYAQTAQEIEEMTGKQYKGIHIVGGGANASYLNELTAKACRKKVYAGPTEATALGNLAVQMIASGELADLKAARKSIFDSFPMQIYDPER